MKLLLPLLAAAVLTVPAFGTPFTFKPVDTFSGGDSNHTDLDDLDHPYAYTWGITGTHNGASFATLKQELAEDYVITSAILTIKNIYNWNAADTGNQLFIHLLDNPKTGVRRVVDDPNDRGVNQGVLSDYFNGKIAGNFVNGKWVAYGHANTAGGAVLATGATNVALTQYHDANGPASVDQFSFSFSVAQLGLLTSYLENGHTGGTGFADFGLGFDPDCHFFNDGVKLVLTTQAPTRSVPDSGGSIALLGCGFLGVLTARAIARRPEERRV